MVIGVGGVAQGNYGVKTSRMADSGMDMAHMWLGSGPERANVL